MTSATYKYLLKADSGYKSEQAGKISPERHGVVCAVLDGGLTDDLVLLRAAQDLLDALQSAPLTLHTGSMFVDGACKCSQCEFVHKARAAISKATSNSN